jgi:hypothetical protein
MTGKRKEPSFRESGGENPRGLVAERQVRCAGGAPKKKKKSGGGGGKRPPSYDSWRDSWNWRWFKFLF